LGRILGVDVRARGSGNIGATNIARTLGLGFGVLTLLADMAKGALPVLVGVVLNVGPWGLAFAGAGAILGHVFSLFARLRGGKGVATAAGVFLVLSPPALMGALASFAVVAWLSRIASLASLTAGASIPILLLLMGDRGPRLWLGLAVIALLLFTHRDNLRRLRSGTEPRFGRVVS
jgi:glycerol-3-phosphate acyltransferase PlsY